MRVYKKKLTNRIIYFRNRRQSAVAGKKNTRLYDFFYAYIHTLITLVPRLNKKEN